MFRERFIQIVYGLDDPVVVGSPKGGIMATVMQRAFIGLHRSLYRASGGRILAKVSGLPVLLLTTKGRNSGRDRTIPVVYLEEDGHYVLAASNGGADRHPVWFLNLVANPTASVQVGRRKVRIDASIPEGDTRDEVWERFKAKYKRFQGYELKTDRSIPVVLLTPHDMTADELPADREAKG